LYIYIAVYIMAITIWEEIRNGKREIECEV
jgi:hypothetical protein